ncbi:MAG TPA: AI-2E family transporter [Candidatus Binataceae bacterium]|nr:AI-2E family transporter [Candidatus Binataceae bacterium]
MSTVSSVPPVRNHNHRRRASPAPTFFWIVFGIVVLYFGREILLPLALAAMLAVILSPIASLVERPLGRFFSSLIVILIAVGFLVATLWFFGMELSGVAKEMASYSHEIGAKLSSLEKEVIPPVERLEHTVNGVQQQISHKTNPSGHHPLVVQALPIPPSVVQQLSPALPIFAAMANVALILLLLFFLLYGRADLCDRAVRLFARAGVMVAGEAIDSAAKTVSRYLLLLSLMNLLFGITIGITTWLLGLERPILWGSLAFFLRYVPYVGSLISGALPTMVAFAVFPGWLKAGEVLASFVLLDQAIAQFFEPFFIGPGIGISPVALVVAAVFWTWLWGPAGLVLSTPLSACLKVAGDYVPALGFFSILLATDPLPQEFHGYYRRLLMFDRKGAQNFVEAYCEQFGTARTTSRVLMPALDLAALETAQGKIGAVNERFIVETTKQLSDELAERSKAEAATQNSEHV